MYVCVCVCAACRERLDLQTRFGLSGEDRAVGGCDGAVQGRRDALRPTGPAHCARLFVLGAVQEVELVSL